MSTFSDASLVLVPSGIKNQKVYSIKPTDGSGDLTFSRASNATRVNSSGLVEKVRTNLITYSQDFSNAAWSKTGCTVTADYATAPDGTNTADRLVFGASGNEIVASLTGLTVGAEYSVSFYAKTESGTFNFDFGNIDYIVEAGTATNEWQRFTVTQQAASTTRFPKITASGSGTLILWGFQVESGVTTDYIATTTTAVSVGPVSGLPRLDYTPTLGQSGGGGCPSLLLEPQRTNLANWSEQADQYTKAGATIGSNVVTSPDGYTNADSLIEDASNGAHAFYNFGLTTFTTSAYTASVFAKKGSRDWFALQLYHGSSHIAYFNLNMGLVGNVAAGATATITNYGNGWYRCTITATTTANAGGIAMYAANADNSISYAGTNGLTAGYFYGWQLELGAYATSYIGPTYSSAVTRVADAASKTGASAIIGQTEGTLYSEFVVNGFADFGTPLCINNGSTTESVWLTTFANGDIRAEVFSSTGGGIQASFTKSGNVVGQTYKIAIGYAANNFAFFVNGTQVGTTDTSGTVPVSMSRVDFDYTNPASFVKSALEIKQALLFKTRLSNADLATLTA